MTGAPQSLPAVTSASPYPSGPPPPYSQPPPPASHHANAWPGAQLGVRTPPESRRASGEEQDAKQSTRQSLPSISEALGVDSQTSYSASTPAPPSAALAHPAHQPSVAPSSPKRSYAMEPPPLPQNAYGSNGTYPTYPQYRPEAPVQQSYAPHEPPRSAPTPERPPLHLQTSQASSQGQQPQYNYPTSTSPGFEQRSAHTAGSTGPSSFPYGYTPYPPRYAQPTPPASVTNGPIYQPSANYPAPHTPSTSWKPDGSRYGDARPAAPAEYGTSVKRHMDMYDLEGALTDVSIMFTFQRTSLC